MLAQRSQSVGKDANLISVLIAPDQYASERAFTQDNAPHLDPMLRHRIPMSRQS